MTDYVFLPANATTADMNVLLTSLLIQKDKKYNKEKLKELFLCPRKL
jgi:hypothetical protein